MAALLTAASSLPRLICPPSTDRSGAPLSGQKSRGSPALQLNAGSTACRPSPVCSASFRHIAASVAASPQPISFQFDETSFSVRFSPDEAQKLKAAIDKLLQTFREKEKATRPQRWESLDFRFSGDGVFVEVFCNPNAYSNAFQAKALITVKSEAVRVSTEGPLSAVKSSVEEYLAAN